MTNTTFNVKIVGNMKKWILVLISASVVVSTSAFVFAAVANRQEEDNTITKNTSTPMVKQEEDKEIKVEVEEPQPVSSPQPPQPPQPTSPVSQPASQPTAPEPVVYKWTQEMSAAGITETDYGYVTDMVLDENGWRIDYSKKLWQHAYIASKKSSLVESIQYADRWVKLHHGTWQQANEIWNRAGNF